MLITLHDYKTILFFKCVYDFTVFKAYILEASLGGTVEEKLRRD